MGRVTDEQLVQQLRGGDQRAFEQLHDRYRRALVSYAKRFVRRSEHDAEDIVQDVFVNAHAALVGERPPELLRAWLYRAVRNRCIDEVRRARFGEVELPAERSDDAETDPAVLVLRRQRLHHLVDDIAELPERQRLALVAHEFDGDDLATIGARMGISAQATEALLVRARDGLVKQRFARDADCHAIREQLAAAHTRGVRPAEASLRHVKTCTPCRSYRRSLKGLKRSLAALGTPPLLGPLAALGIGKVAAVATVGAAAVAAGGFVVLDRSTVHSGETQPLRTPGASDYVISRKGQPLSKDTSMVIAKVQVPAGPATTTPQTGTLACPAGQVAVAPAATNRELPVTVDFMTTINGRPVSLLDNNKRVVTWRLMHPALAKPLRFRFGIVCRTPGARGSLAANPRPVGPGETAARVCRPDTYLHFKPGGVVVGTVFDQQPVAIKRTKGKWALITSDTRNTGWIERRYLC